jgi:ABC-2 type transport system permease protein
MTLDWRRVLELTRKEAAQLLRDPRTRMLIFAAPIVQLLMFGYAVRTDIANTALYVVDRDRTAQSRELIDAFRTTGYFTLVGVSDRSVDLVRALDAGRTAVGLELPPGFTRAMESGRPAVVQLLFDGSQSNTATVAQGYATLIVGAYARAHAPTGTPPGGLDVRMRAWFNPTLESRAYNVPGVIALLILLMCLTLTSLAVVREREFGTLDQLMVTPLQPREFLLGKTLPVAAIAVVDLAVITLIAVAWFGIPFRAPLLVMVPASLLFILTGIAMGLLISTLAQTQQEAFMTMFLFLLPSIILSGFFYPITSMPTVFQWLTLANPVRHFLAVVRAAFLRGEGLAGLWAEVVALAVIGAATMTAALWRLRRGPGAA